MTLVIEEGFSADPIFLCLHFILLTSRFKRCFTLFQFILEGGDAIAQFFCLFAFCASCLLCLLSGKFCLLLRLRFLLRAQLFKFRTLLRKRLFAGGDFALPPIAFTHDRFISGTHFFFKRLFTAIKLTALFIQLLKLFAIACFKFAELLSIVKRGLIVKLIIAAFSARNTRCRLFEHAHIHRGGGGIGKIKVFIGNEAVYDGARIFPLRLVLFRDRLSRLGKREVFPSSAADRTAPI